MDASTFDNGLTKKNYLLGRHTTTDRHATTDQRLAPLELSLISDELLASYIPCLYDTESDTVMKIVIPDASLSRLPWVRIRAGEDLRNIPASGGCYWIITDEPIKHCFNSGTHCPVVLPSGLTVVYNGVSGGLRARAKQHLLRDDSKGGFGSTSGISVDLLKKEIGFTKSHTKWMWHESGRQDKHKLPKVWINGSYQKQTSKHQILTTLSDEEKDMALGREELRFKNGINVLDTKHQPYSWIFIFVPISVHNIRDYIESEWRKEYGVPVLCTYKSGR